MRSRIIQIVVLAVVMVCLWAHVSELFDTWDHALDTGNDIESTLAAVALCVGASVVFARVLFRFFRSFGFEYLPILCISTVALLRS